MNWLIIHSDVIHPDIYTGHLGAVLCWFGVGNGGVVSVNISAVFGVFESQRARESYGHLAVMTEVAEDFLSWFRSQASCNI